MKIVAHRGDSELFPENTMVSFDGAIKAGADAIELDVHMTSDRGLVVHHDYYLGRTNNGEGRIYEQPLSYIKSLDAGSWFGSSFCNQRVPLLAEVFSSFQRTIRFELELKGFDVSFIREVTSLVDQYNLWDSIEFTSASNYLISCLKQDFPNAQVGVFVPQPEPWMDIRLAQELAISSLTLGNIDVGHFPLKLVTSDFVKRLKQRNILTHIANCDSEADIRQSLDLTADQISTTKLRLAVALVQH